MKRKIQAGTTQLSLPVIVYDNTSTTGAGLSGLTHTTSGLILEYRRQGQSSWTQLGVGTGLVSKTLGTYVSGGIVASGSRAGRYEIDIPNDAIAAGARMVELCLRGAANMHPVDIEIELDAVNYQDATRFGLTALPNVAQGSSGALATGNASGQVTVATLTSGAIQSFWDALTSGLLTAGSIGKWIIDNLNATVSSRASQASVDGKPTLGQIEASTVLAKEQSVSSLLDRLGAFTGSGANTVLGFFRALMRKDAGIATPTDVGGTYSNATDSIEAIRDRGDEAWITGSGGGGGGGTGTGARAVSITVLDNFATPIQSATVRVSRSGQTFAVQTNASGVALFSLDDATWTVSITSPGYAFSPVSLVVNQNVSTIYSGNIIAPTPPAPFAGLCNVQFSVIHLGLPVANATVVALLEDENPTVNNYLVSRQITSGSTDLNGNCVLTLVQYAQFTRGGVYRIRVADSQGKTIHDRRVTIPSTSTANAEDLQDAR